MERVAFLIEETNEQIRCLLNPESLVIQRVAGVQPRQSIGGQLTGSGQSDDPLLYTGGGRMEIHLDLLFDVTLAGSSIATDNVRALTAPFWALAENSARLGYGRPPQVRFLWGKDWDIPGIVLAVAEHLEQFTPAGIAQRSWLRMRLVRVNEPSFPVEPTRSPAPSPAAFASADLDNIPEESVQVHAVIGGGAERVGTGPAVATRAGAPQGAATAATPDTTTPSGSQASLADRIVAATDTAESVVEESGPSGTDAVGEGAPPAADVIVGGEGGAVQPDPAPETTAGPTLTPEPGDQDDTVDANQELFSGRGTEPGPIAPPMQPFDAADPKASAEIAQSVEAAAEVAEADAISAEALSAPAQEPMAEEAPVPTPDADTTVLAADETQTLSPDETISANETLSAKETQTLSTDESISTGDISPTDETLSADETVSPDETLSAEETQTFSTDESISTGDISSTDETLSADEMISADEALSTDEALFAGQTLSPDETLLADETTPVTEGVAEEPPASDETLILEEISVDAETPISAEGVASTAPGESGAVPEEASTSVDTTLPTTIDPDARPSSQEPGEPGAESTPTLDATSPSTQITTTLSIESVVQPQASMDTEPTASEPAASVPSGESVEAVADAPTGDEIDSASMIAGERLDQLAFRYYGDPRYWRLLAIYNNIDDPMHVSPSLLLRVPPGSAVSAK